MSFQPTIENSMGKQAGTATPVQSREIASGAVRAVQRRWPWILTAAVVIVLVASVLLLRYFPFSEKKVIESLLETFPSKLTVDHFETVYFPHPGCKAEGVAFRSLSSPSGSRPLVTIGTVTIQGTYADLLLRPHHIARVILDRLRVQIPQLGNAGAFTGGYTDSKMSIGEVLANGAVLEIGRAGEKPSLRFDIHELGLESVSAKDGISYRVAMRNPEPPGEI